MENAPFVSFCFTTFKRHDHLKTTLEGIRRQTFTDFEVVVSDNDPEGSARPVIEGFNDPRFKYFPNGQNLGMKPSFNKSLERSSGKYIVMIADDDPVYHDMLETLVTLTEKYPGYGMYLGGCNWFCTEPDLAEFYNCKVGVNSCLAAKPVGTVDVYTPDEFLKSFFNFKIFPNYLWSTGIVRRDVLIESGGVPDYGTAFLGDYAYMSIMGGHSGAVIINKALGHQTLHKQNFGRDQNEQLVILGPKFVEYVSARLSHVKDWPEIKKMMLHFVAVWLVRHLGFLKAYNVYTGNAAANKELESCESRIFAIPFMRPYKMKYFLLTKFPVLHDGLVNLKKRLKH
jgi:glycosyltransferase involved in cell wall biosynthesis